MNTLSQRLRGFLIGVAIGFVAVALALLVTSGAPTANLTAGGVAFSFSYPGMARVAAPPGTWLALETRTDGRLADSLTVGPWTLPAYSGDISGLAPVLTANYLPGFAARTPGFEYQSAGRTRIDGLAGYIFTYRRQLDGTTYYGATVFLTPQLRGDRHGVVVAMLVQPKLAAVKSPDAIGEAGPLYEPLQTFELSGD
jgi:hypothetical protein